MQKADLGIGGVTLNFDRSKAVDYLYPHFISSVTFITKAPQVTSNIFLVFKPLSMDVWIYFIASLFVLIAFDIAFNYFNNGLRVQVFWIGMNTMFRQQYAQAIPAITSLSIWNTFWAIFTFILTTAYAGCLCSLITVPIKMKTIDTCLELSQAALHNKIVVTAIGNSAYSDAIQVQYTFDQDRMECKN